MDARLLIAIRDARGLTPWDKLVLFALASRTDAEGWAWPSFDCLANDTGISRRKVADVVAELAARGAVEVARGRQHVANRYRIVAAALPSSAHGARLEVASSAPHAPLGDSSGAPGALLPEPSSAPRAPLEGPAVHTASSSSAPGALEGIQEGKKERETRAPEGRTDDRESGVRVAAAPASSSELPFAMPDDWPLTGDAKASAEIAGVRDVEHEWSAFRFEHIKRGEIHTARQWHAAWGKWCMHAKRFQSSQRTRDAARGGAAREEVVVERPYHRPAKGYAQRPTAQASDDELAGVASLRGALAALGGARS
ncbi:MAG TPA: helix-turn-helix domain-containing protein [Polyangiaceae bacterium]